MGTSTVDLGGVDTGLETLDTTGGGEQTENIETEGYEGSEQGGHEQGMEGGERTDGRTGPKAYRDAAKAASEALPEHAETIKKMAADSFRLAAHQAVFAKPEEALQAKQLIEAFGGVEGVGKVQERIQSFDQQDEALRTANPVVIDSFFKDFPEGAAALAPAYLDKLAQVNPQALSAAVVPYAIGILEGANFGGHLQAIQNEKDPSRKEALVKELADWYAGQKQGAQQMRQKPQASPQDARLKERETALAVKEEGIFREGVAAKVTSTVMPALDKTVDAYAKQYKLTDPQKEHFKDTLAIAARTDMENDKSYMQQLELRKANKGRTHDTVASYISGEFNRRMATKALEVAKKIYGAPRAGGQQQAAPGGGVAKPGGAKTAPGGLPFYMPNFTDDHIDQAKTSDMDLVAGRAWLKDGRYVTRQRPQK